MFDPDIPDATTSLTERAKQRTVTFVPFDGEWSVTGSAKLGDSRTLYTVRWDGAKQKYDCQCHHSDHGQVRARKMCSHVLAVILHRKATDPRKASSQAPRSTSCVGDASTAPAARTAPAVASPGAVTQDPVRATPVPDPRDGRFGAPPIPTQFSSIRPHQWDAVERIEEEFKTKHLVFVEAPTGSGKSLVGELARRLVVPTMGKAVYACSSIQLQDQFVRDFDYARLIMGRGNYEPLDGPDGVTCADCTAAPPNDPDCMWCPDLDRCPYRVAKSRAGGAELAVLNTSYLLHTANHAKDFIGRDLYIIDEADTLEQSLMGFVEVSIGERMMKDLDLGQPRFVTKPESWRDWLIDVVIPRVAAELSSLPHQTDDLRVIRRKKSLAQLIGKLDKVSEEVADGGWVFDDYQRGRATFRPIKVDSFGSEYLWQHGDKWLLMSATIISPDSMAESLGWTGDYGVVRVPSTFPPENRPIIVAPIARMTNNPLSGEKRENATREQIEAAQRAEWDKMATAIVNITRRHPGERMLVHTVSYALMNHLADALRAAGVKNVMTYAKASERDVVLARFRKTTGAVLLAPSMERGVDLPHDDCRVVVVAKMPFLSLGDKQVNARLRSAGGQTWYTVEAIRSLVQMTGRGVRSATDTCTTYILDSTFSESTWKKNRSLLPSWWKESLQWSFPKRELMAPITA